MKSYKFKLSKLAFAGCIVGILLGICGIAFTIYRMLAPSLGFSSPQLIIQHIVIIIASLLALVIFPAILIHSVYKVTDKEIILWFGIIKSTFLLKDIESVHLFTKTNKLVVYFKDDRYTVIVVKPDWYNEFIKDICNANKDIRYDVSTTDSDDSDVPQKNQANSSQTQDARSDGFAFLCFLFPIVGLILYLVWKDTLPLRAKSCGKGAIIGVIVEVVMFIICMVIITAAAGTARAGMYY